MDHDGLFEELRAAGEVESHGRFTVDAVRALRKLREFQLGSPSEYALKVLQAAVVGQAESLSVSFLPDRTVFMAPSAMAPDLATDSPMTRHLAVALNGALAVEGSSVEIVWRQGEARGGVEFGENGTQAKMPPASLRSGFRLAHKFHEPRWTADTRLLGGLIVGPPAPDAEEARWLRQYGRFAPIPLRVGDAATASRGYPPGGVNSLPFMDLLTQQLSEDHPDMGLQSIRITGMVRCGVGRGTVGCALPIYTGRAWRCAAFDTPRAAWLRDAWHFGESQVTRCAAIVAKHHIPLSSRLYLVKDGVVLREILPLHPPGVTAVADADAVSVDLSQFHPIHDEAFATLVRNIEHVAEKFWREA